MIRACLVLLLAACSVASGCVTRQPPHADLTVRVEPSSRPSALTVVPGVQNFGVFTDDVWRGARPTTAGLRALADLGVKTVIDLQELDASADVPPGLRYVPLRVSGWHADQVDTAAVLKAIDENPKPVFIHCLEGRDRTGLAVGAYRLSRGMPMADVTAELQCYGVHFWWKGPIERRLRQIAAADARLVNGAQSAGLSSP